MMNECCRDGSVSLHLLTSFFLSSHTLSAISLVWSGPMTHVPFQSVSSPYRIIIITSSDNRYTGALINIRGINTIADSMIDKIGYKTPQPPYPAYLTLAKTTLGHSRHVYASESNDRDTPSHSLTHSFSPIDYASRKRRRKGGRKEGKDYFSADVEEILHLVSRSSHLNPSFPFSLVASLHALFSLHFLSAQPRCLCP